jgi:hypothetical protein
MIPHTQRHLASIRRRDGHTIDGIPGDCLRTCVASIFDKVRLDAVPHFAMYTPPLAWWRAMRLWARERSLDFACVTLEDIAEGSAIIPPDTYTIASGPSPRGPWGHVCVADSTGRIVHDPHPSRAGLLAVEELIVITQPYEPAPVLRQLTVGPAR